MAERDEVAIPVYDQQLHRLLRSTKKDQPIIAIKASEYVPTAFKAMIDNQILSLPVFDVNEVQIGFVDIIDILHFVLKEIVRKGYDELTRYEDFKFKKVGDIINMSRRNSILKVTHDATLWTVLNAMVDFGELHRVPIVNRNGETVGLLSQFDVIQFLKKFVDENDFGLFTVRDFQLGYKNNVVRISKEATAKDAFFLMKEKGVSAVAVVTDQDRLYANLSATDLRSIGFDTSLFGKLSDTVESYLKLVPPNKAFGLNPVFARPSDDLRIVFRKFIDAGVHRLYVVEDAFEILGVISLVDVIKLILSCCNEKAVRSPPTGYESPNLAELSPIHPSGSDSSKQ